MATPQALTPYAGTKRRLVISLDVGTTYSGASYMILVPGQVPKKYSVTGFKAQEDLCNSSKVPTVILYDKDGKLKKCGAEAIKEYDPDASDIKVEWFKLRLSPQKLLKNTSRKSPDVNIPPKSNAIKVLADYLRFLKDCVREEIVDTQPGGEQIWESLAPQAQYILSHPNGWEGEEQNKIREAAVKGGLISNHDTDGDRVEFVTEGEASFHWCVANLPDLDMLQVGSIVVIADAGGGTIDVSSFRVTCLKPLEVEEVRPPSCALAGSLFVNDAFRERIQIHLGSSVRFQDDKALKKLVEEFDSKFKGTFRGDGRPIRIRIGGRDETDEKIGIINGTLVVPSDLVAASFEDSYSAITGAVREHLTNRTPDSYIFLVGGFAANPFLYSKVKDDLSDLDIPVKRNNSHTSKAVAEGGLLVHLESHVTKRIAKYTIGIEVERVFSFAVPSHLGRFFQRQTCPISGKWLIPGGFLPLVTKDAVIAKGKEYRESVHMLVTDRMAIGVWKSIKKYSGSHKDIEFLDMDEPASFEHLCTFTANGIPSEALVEVSRWGGRYYELKVDFIITLGGTEVKCYIEWAESGRRRRSRANTVWMEAEETVD